MPAVVRVKRHIDEEPLGAFVLNGKRRRLDNENAEAESMETFAASFGTKKTDEVSTVLKLAGTIDNQDDNATTKLVRLTKEEALSRLTKEEAEELVKFRSSYAKTGDVLRRKREEKRQLSQENRFHVVNCLRKPLLENADEGEEANGEIDEATTGPKLTIVDIEKHPVAPGGIEAPSTSFAATAASSPSLFTNPFNRAPHVNPSTSLFRDTTVQPSDSDTGYVYDLYLAEDQEEEDDYADIDDNRLSAHPYFEECFDMRDDEESDIEDDDSNNENYYANDYPDSDSEPSSDYKIRKALERFNLAYREEFYTDDSSEDELAGYVYGCPNDSTESDDADYYQLSSDLHNQDDEFIHTITIDECKDKDIDICAASDQEPTNTNEND